MKGENNPRWNGGTSEYKNHYLMKRLRMEVLEEANYKCQKIKEDGSVCGAYANEIHHKDKDKSHQAKENFLAVCRKCQISFHIDNWGRKRKYSDLTLKEIGELCGLSESSAWKYFKGYQLRKENKEKIVKVLSEKADKVIV